MQKSTIIDEANLKASFITMFTSFIIQILTWSVKNEVSMSTLPRKAVPCPNLKKYYLLCCKGGFCFPPLKLSNLLFSTLLPKGS